jgi:hypothetical protein
VAPGASAEPHVLVAQKSLVALILMIVSAAVPELLSVTVWVGLVVPTSSSPKARLVVDKVARGDPSIDPPPHPLSRHNPQSRNDRCVFMVPPLLTAGTPYAY